MSITTYRNVRKENFTQIGNELLWNKELSLQAKGLLSIFLSNSDEWELNMKEIIKRSKNGRDATYTIVNELIKHGYFARIEVQNEKLQFEKMIYVFSDEHSDIEREILKIKKEVKEMNKTILVEYKDCNDKNKKIKEKDEPHTESQDADNNPHTESQDTDIEDTESQYINKTNANNTNLNKTNKDKEEEISNTREKNIAFDVLSDFLSTKGIDQQTIDNTIKELVNKRIFIFSMKNIQKQFSYMMERIESGATDNHNGFAVYFANGIQMRSIQSTASKQHKNEQLKEYENLMKQKENNKSLYYNWLEDTK